jgi:hypothetical protein
MPTLSEVGDAITQFGGVNGEGLLSLWEKPLPGQSSGFMLEVLAPIRLTSKCVAKRANADAVRRVQ